MDSVYYPVFKRYARTAVSWNSAAFSVLEKPVQYRLKAFHITL
jgi:hypothetical protein